ncbi:hypothetical protein FJY71_10020 [candidate division WOR-3 bacterium]|nr:hypothetical protein [candidate division WOR-3 bacterium]
MRTTLLLLALTGAVAAGVWQEDTLFRLGPGPAVHSGRYPLLVPGDTYGPLTLPYYPWTQLWVYGLLDSIPGKVNDGPSVIVEWRWGTYDAYRKNYFYYCEWTPALPTIWHDVGPYATHMTTYDSLYLGPLYDPNVPLSWVDRVQLRIIGETDRSDTCAARIWVRRRMGAEAGDVLQWLPYRMPQ